MKINLGSSDRHFGGYVNVDRVPPADEIVDLSKPWPWPESSVDEFRAWDILEHLVNPIHSMNEAFYCLRPGGIFDIVVPTTDGRGWAQDPGHICMPPWNRNSFFYFTDGDPHRERFGDAYGIKARFQIIGTPKQELLQDEVAKLSIVLRAVK